ncbi:hypothetical protein DPMN_063066, partial [Dreissena polymorpha]
MADTPLFKSEAQIITALSLRTENRRLEEHCRNLVSRRDHLLAVNARLTLPLSLTQPATQVLTSIYKNTIKVTIQ